MVGVASDSPVSVDDDGVVGGSGGAGIDVWLALQPMSVSATHHGAKLRIQCRNVFIVMSREMAGIALSLTTCMVTHLQS